MDNTCQNLRYADAHNPVAYLAAPATEAIQAVTGWLQSHGLAPDTVSPSGDMLTVHMSLDKANSVLNANYSAYVHTATNTKMWRTLSYSVPAHIDRHLSFIYPTTQFIPPAVSAFGKTQVAGQATGRPNQTATCAEAMTPQCLQNLYNIPSAPATASGNSIVIGGSAGQAADLKDLKAFLAQERPDIANAPFKMQFINGTTVQRNGTGSVATAAGVQYTVGLASNVSTTVVYPGPEDDADGIQGLFDITSFLLAQDTPPHVFLTNVQYEETAFQTAPEVAQSLCNSFAQLGARGTSVIVTSGSSGDTSSAMFPATCPYVTSVGSTQGSNPERAADFSSGGFSNVFPRPAYQLDAVGGYLKQVENSDASSVNTTGRAYPDVSAQGAQFVVEVGGQVQSVNSTTVSGATFAAVVALLSDRLLNAGKPPLGFLNPLLYSKGFPGLNDIVSGSSSEPSGFTATTGWDPITGLGTPDFEKLLEVVAGSNSNAKRSRTAETARRSFAAPTADAIRGSGLEGLFPFASSQNQGSNAR
ncbi:hypothetical protein VTO73DRAFT_6938 [Trametes versicolor]